MPALRLRAKPTPVQAIYICGFFGLSHLQMIAVATPLWGSHLGLSAALIGLASGCRSVSPLLYSIHLGSLLDIVGVRRLLIFFAVQCAVLPLLYPLLPMGGPFLVLQVVLGLASATVWVAAQTAIARSGDSTSSTGRFSFFASTGTVVGPLILGLVWSRFGADAGYGLISAWGFVLTAASIILPRRTVVARPRLNLAHFVPRLHIYRQALASLKQPIIALVMMCTFIRLGAISMMESFFPILGQNRGFSAATVGVLFSLGNLSGSLSSLVATPWVRICGSLRVALLSGVAFSTVCLALLPLLSEVWLLAIAIVGYGFGMGVSMPVILTVLSRGMAPEQQGMTAGVRATANQLGGFVLPVAVGLFAELTGVAIAFWVNGLILTIMVLLVAATIGRRVSRLP